MVLNSKGTQRVRTHLGLGTEAMWDDVIEGAQHKGCKANGLGEEGQGPLHMSLMGAWVIRYMAMSSKSEHGCGFLWACRRTRCI